MLTKRLYKKATFLLILVLIPALILVYGAAAQEKSGVITVALACEERDPLTEKLIEKLSSDSPIINYLICDTPLEAEQKVRLGKADAAWIFAENLEDRIPEFIRSRSRKDAFVTVLERESNVAVTLAREKLSGTVFSLCSREMYLNHIRQNAPELDGVSDEKLMEHYDSILMGQGLFEYADIHPVEKEDEVSYLITPVRGLLAVVIVLCGLATAMYYIQDLKKGTFAWVPERKLPWVEMGISLISVVNVSIVALLSLAILEQTGSLGRELLVVALYALCVMAFSMLIRRLCGSLSALGTLLPLLLVAMMVVCPVFFDFGVLRKAQWLFPPTYFIQASVNDLYLWAMPLYILVLLLCYWLTGKLLKRQ